jgi:hypothetical protein
MTYPPDSGEAEVEARYRDLLFLHAQSPDFRGVDLSVLPGYGDHSVDEAMRAVAAAPPEEIPVSARLAVLYDLARADLPERRTLGDAYSELAESTLALKPEHPPEFVPGRLVSDLTTAAREGLPFHAMGSADAFEHHEMAFIGEGVCTIRRVQVDGIPATWVYSEFDTDATFDHVAEWVDPRNWRARGPLLFRRMELLGAPPAPVTITPPPDGEPHWQGVFHEEVRLAKLVNTMLRCNFWRSGDAAASTYDLDLSLDGEIDVDRGFLLVTDTGRARRVQVLKIVGFTANWWDSVAALVCPFWTDWIRTAVETGTTSGPAAPSQTPDTETSPCVATVDEWVSFLGRSLDPYVAMGSEMTSRIRSREYATSDLLADSTRVWSQLAKDWARAWNSWSETIDEVAEQGLDAGFTPPGVPRHTGRRTPTAPGGRAAPSSSSASSSAPAATGGTVVRVAGLATTDTPVCSDLVSIDVTTTTLPAADVTVTVQTEQDGVVGARVETTNASVPHGLYVGRLATTDGRPLAPVHLYISRATRV